MSNSLRPYGLWPVRFLCPGVGCHFLLQGIFLTQGLNPVSYVSHIGRWDIFFTSSATWKTQLE